ncbi:MAG: type II toxin-antitoxin system VapC family toxin [Chloroflexota bacterium]
MGVIYIADTNIVSELMRPAPNKRLLNQWEQNHSQTAITAITWHELLVGVNRLHSSRKKEAFERFLQAISETMLIFPYNQAAAKWHAVERARLIGKGLSPSFADGQIAGIASTQQKILVTRNVKDFTSYNNLSLLNWFEIE